MSKQHGCSDNSQSAVNEASAAYRLQAGKAALIKPGYKMTEVGVIPVDWDIKHVGDFADVGSGGTPSREKPAYWGGSIPWVTTSQIDFGVITEADQFITEEGLKNSAAKLLPTGTLLMALYGQGKTRGKVGVLGIPAATNQACASIALHAGVLPEFVLHFLTSRYEAIRNSSNTGGQENLNGNIVKGTSVAFPPLPEQRAIAAALSDVDALLDGLERLIAKKRDLKHAAMQQLLTGQTRLPGFSGEWSKINVAKHAKLNARIGWQALTTEEYLKNGTHFLVTGTDFVDGRVNWATCHYVDEWRYNQDRNIQLKNCDVLLTKDGTIGKVGYVDGLPGPATLNSGVFVIRPVQEAFVPLFLFYVLASQIFDDFLAMITAGSTIVHLYQKDFVGFEFLAPDTEEQTAIAAVLSDMDAELAALEARRDKTRALKQGMIQELLTGKTRLL
ncbi:restriction endonuclease subunit S [Methylomonas sp. LW13]|uniref:restriction endonuclease subunit S n=1 Tax=unclassified Methylomonas TaxID=2608980 RepID=UPI00068BD087|nr:restriction endonuclease subunit S [Methylomonas sp. LW13]QBC26108.1 restriction endonuclease subunit S [Methylomonas sp. LW13]